MTKLLITILAFGLMLMPFVAHGQSARTAMVVTQSEETATEAPPVSQALVPEGDFAVKLAAALDLGTPTTEAQAEDLLTSVGIEPQNGWIADYPMTPIVLGELQNAVAAAAAAEKIPMGKDEALQALQDTATGFGLAISPATDQYAESQPPTSSEYVQPTVVNNYYTEEGPPVVTYYLPPPDYYYLYSWVPYPFWFSGFYFPGYFILNDFDFTVFVHFHGHRFHHHVITNHFFDPRFHRYFRVDPRMRRHSRTFLAEHRHSRGFSSPEVRRGATSIFNRSAEARRSGSTINGATGRRFEGTVRHGTAGRAFAQPGGVEREGRMTTRSFIHHRGGDFGVTSGRSFSSRSEGFRRSFGHQRSLGLASRGSFSRPSEGFTRSFGSSARSFSAPRSSFGGHHGGFGGFHHGGFGGFHGGGFHGGGGFRH